MAQIFPSTSQSVDLRDGTTILINKIKILSSTSDHVFIPPSVDAQLLQSDRTTADPTFYITDKGRSFNIDGATAGTEYVLVSRHEGQINFGSGRGTDT